MIPQNIFAQRMGYPGAQPMPARPIQAPMVPGAPAAAAPAVPMPGATQPGAMPPAAAPPNNFLMSRALPMRPAGPGVANMMPPAAPPMSAAAIPQPQNALRMRLGL